MKKQITWINCARLIAAIAVIIDHSSMVLYNSEKFKMTTFFSVTVFIILSGYTTYLSYRNIAPKDIQMKTIKKLIKIIGSYLIAVFIYQIAMFDYFDLKEYFSHVMKFDLKGPFYYILIYIQYVIVGPFLVSLVRFFKKHKTALLWEVLFLIPVVGISLYCISNSYMSQSYGAGQYLLGGTFFVFFYLGILFASHPIEIKKLSMKIINCMVSIMAWSGMWFLFVNKTYFLDEYFQTGQKLNPPGITVGIYALLTYWMIFSVFQLVPTQNKVIKTINYVGHCSLYIFLYHELCLIVMTKILPLESYAMKWCIYFPIMLIAPVLVKYLLDKMREPVSIEK